MPASVAAAPATVAAPVAAPSVDGASPVCGSDIARFVVPMLIGANGCDDPHLTLTYRRVSLDSHDVIGVLLVDDTRASADRHLRIERGYWFVDRHERECGEDRCDAIDALHASLALDDTQLQTLLAIAAWSGDPSPRLDRAGVATLLADVPAADLVAQPVGLARAADHATLTAVVPHLEPTTHDGDIHVDRVEVTLDAHGGITRRVQRLYEQHVEGGGVVWRAP